MFTRVRETWQRWRDSRRQYKIDRAIAEDPREDTKREAWKDTMGIGGGP
jgi:hypothetical protein